MIPAIAIARSGLLAGIARLHAGAANIANASTTGPLPRTPAPGRVAAAQGGEPRVYQAVEVVLHSTGAAQAPAGLGAAYRPRLPSHVRQYDPSAPFADGEGFVAAPNVDLAAEALDVLAASMAFRANLAVLRAAQTTTKHLLDLDA